MTPVEHLESVAQQLAARLREDDPESVARWLVSELPDPADWFRLNFALAIAYPIDRTWRQATAWTRPAPVDSPVDISKRRRMRRVA
jgi:hypothetical protein